MAPAGKGMEEQLMTALRFGGLDRDNLQELVKATASFAEKGIRPIKIFPIGIPSPDGVEMHAIVTNDALQSLISILKNPRIHTVRIFPKGIPVPDVFLTEIRIR